MLHRDAGLASLALVARFHGKAVDPEQLRHELGIGEQSCAEDVLRAAKRVGLKAVLDTMDLRRVRVPMPCVAELKGGSGFVALARMDGARALIQEDGRPVVLPLDELEARLSGRVLLLASRAPASAAVARFGFGWFIPAISKYRRLIGRARARCRPDTKRSRR